MNIIIKKNNIKSNNCASAKAKPKIAEVNNCPLILGFLAVDEIKEEKITTISIPPPINLEQVNISTAIFSCD